MRGSTESMTESPAGLAVPCFTVHMQEPKLRKAGLGALAHVQELQSKAAESKPTFSIHTQHNSSELWLSDEPNGENP